jgi:hypothetical protein
MPIPAGHVPTVIEGPTTELVAVLNIAIVLPAKLFSAKYPRDPSGVIAMTPGAVALKEEVTLSVEVSMMEIEFE